MQTAVGRRCPYVFYLTRSSAMKTALGRRCPYVFYLKTLDKIMGFSVHLHPSLFWIFGGIF